MRTSLSILLFIVLGIVCRSPSHALSAQSLQARVECNYVLATTSISGNWEIVLFDRTNTNAFNLTQSVDDERDPDWSPDGRLIVYAGNRSDNWDIYTFSLGTDELRRLTTDSAYDGFPSFSPTGTQLAFESYRDGNLDVYIMQMDGSAPRRVTNDPAADSEPIWNADGTGLIFTSWRSGSRQLYQIDLKTSATIPLTTAGEEARQPRISPDGQMLAYVSFSNKGSIIKVLSLSNGETTELVAPVYRAWPLWVEISAASPNKRTFELTVVEQKDSVSPALNRWQLGPISNSQQGTLDEFGKALTEGTASLRRPTCQPITSQRLYPQKLQYYPAISSLNVATVVQQPGSFATCNLTKLPDVQALQPRLCSVVADSFQRLRTRIYQESGHDFLSVLNDAWRGLDHPGGAYLSWHKTGRAIDLRDWFAPKGQQSLYIARETIGEYTYFRLFLRTVRQDGTQGEPLRDSLWETEGRLTMPETARDGGKFWAPPVGYYVDFTELAEREGWTRIPALTPPQGNWQAHYIDMEFWHYEHRGGLSWYQAMKQMYSAEDLKDRFSLLQIIRRGYTIADVQEAGIPGAIVRRNLRQEYEHAYR